MPARWKKRSLGSKVRLYWCSNHKRATKDWLRKKISKCEWHSTISPKCSASQRAFGAVEEGKSSKIASLKICKREIVIFKPWKAPKQLAGRGRISLAMLEEGSRWISMILYVILKIEHRKTIWIITSREISSTKPNDWVKHLNSPPLSSNNN